MLHHSATSAFDAVQLRHGKCGRLDEMGCDLRRTCWNASALLTSDVGAALGIDAACMLQECWSVVIVVAVKFSNK